MTAAKRIIGRDLLGLGALIFVVVVDQVTKAWVMAAFRLYERKEIIPGWFNLTYVTNTGAAFGMLAGENTGPRQVFFVAIALAALVVIGVAYRHFRQSGLIGVMAAGLIAGGAVGNLIDRLRFGAVVDFLDFYVKASHWPAFNVADSAISVGVALFLLCGFRQSAGSDEG